MKNRGQVLPVGKWIAGLILLFTLLISYEYFSPLIDTTLPANAAQMQGYNPYVAEIIGSTQSSFWLAILALGFGYVFYLFIAGLPGQQEEYPL